MYTLLNILNYGYFPTIIGFLNIFICLLFANGYKYKIIVLFIYFILSVVSIYGIVPIFQINIIGALIPTPSIYEFLINLLTWFSLAFLLKKTILKDKARIIFILCLISIGFYFIFNILYPLLFDILEIYFIIIICKYYYNISRLKFYTILIFNIFANLLIGYFITEVSWEKLKNDYRPNNITMFANKRLNNHENGYYYIFNCINDTESRFCKIIKEINNIQNGNNQFIFLEDSISTFSFLRTSIALSPFGVDPIEYNDNKIGNLIIKKANELYYDKFIYRTSNVNFYIKNILEDRIVFKYDYNELTCTIFSSFQKYLETCNTNYINKKIILINKEEQSKIELYYYSSKQYTLKLLYNL